MAHEWQNVETDPVCLEHYDDLVKLHHALKGLCTCSYDLSGEKGFGHLLLVV